ncbi:hypothetical protein MUGA111182_04895 [Mucilaginibacter galii]|uniref:SWIM-type domain-containing protein n=1 Tax=Mucilaginibacter galii TaxID=2005073 RepID=A0A917JB14_9SPHI|nr:hypothetical protein [Mucilaginibacter galii]GGI50786.1 hypothetical protein GCM10011425_19980 [Mucilaginibacter galii]
MPAKKKIQPTILPVDTFFYAIPLNEGQLHLTRTMLEQHYLLPKGRKLYYGNKVEYISYQHGIITVMAQLSGRSAETLHLHTEPETLHIACSCGMPDRTMCIHAYIGHYNMAWTNTLNLKEFYWLGYDTNEQLQRKYLDVLVSKRFIHVEPQPQFGNLFRPGVGFRGSSTFSLPASATPKADLLQGNRQVMAFCIGYGRMDHLLCQLPVLIPCLATTGSDNSSLVSFEEHPLDCRFVPADVTASQLQLINIAAELYGLINVRGRRSYHPEVADNRALKAVVLQLWEKALPLLAFEAYTCAYTPIRLRFRGGKAGIQKRDIKPCRFSTSRPELYFVLKEQKDHYYLSAALALNGAAFPFDCKTQLFAMDRASSFYLMNTVDADDLLNWIYTSNNRLTVLKEHFSLFEDSFLKQLAEHYPIYVRHTGKGKPVLYTYQDLIKITGQPSGA